MRPGRGGSGERILVVDDDRGIRYVLTELLQARGYHVSTAGGTAEAQALLTAAEFALVLSDVNMPDGSGMELVRQVSALHEDVAVVMMSGVDDPDVASAALELGAYGYLVKPFGSLEIEIQVANALRRRRLEQEARVRRQMLEQLVDERTAQLRQAQEETIRRFALAIEMRNRETGDHVERVGSICGLVALQLGWDDEEAEELRLASVLHDVGKIAIPDRLLLKPGPLTPDERWQMEQHTTIGHRILSGSPSSLLTLAAEIALHHHERVDGAGYPHGLAGDAIAIEARIVSVVDVYDALTTDRPYRRAYSLDRALEVMEQAYGAQFDRVVFDAFTSVLPRVLDMWHDDTARQEAV